MMMIHNVKIKLLILQNDYMTQLSESELIQESEYVFPYHYLTLVSDFQKLRCIEYLNIQQLVKESISPFNKKTILDVGCGDGRLCFELKKENCKIVGVDFSIRAISFARTFNPELEFYVQDVEQLKIPFKFDVIVMMETLEHFIPSKIPIILSNLFNHMKEDGKLIITVPSKNVPLPKKHYQHFDPETLAETIKPYFIILDIKGYGKVGYKKFFFNFLRNIGYVLYFFRYRTLFIKKIFIFMNNYYKRFLGTGRPEECAGLIAICVKSQGIT